eukprot:916180-Pelagomonas_calceolata.AAC.1
MSEAGAAVANILVTKMAFVSCCGFQLGPDALNFVNIFDVDYAKWKDLAIQSSQGLESASSNPDLVRLAW